MEADEFVDLLLEIVEIYVNQLLYVRGVFPEQIFEEQRAFNTPIFKSVYPPLNKYLCNILKAAKQLALSGTLWSMDLVFYKDESTIIETYSILFRRSLKMLNNPTPFLATIGDTYMLGLEEEVRTSICKIPERCHALPKLPHDIKFKLYLYTLQDSFVRLTQTPEQQDFLWIHAPARPDDTFKKKVSLLPIADMENSGVLINCKIGTVH